MQFVPNTHRKQSLVLHEYIFMKGKDNKLGKNRRRLILAQSAQFYFR